jgi:hypothetical protein
MSAAGETSSVWANGVPRESVRPLSEAERAEVEALQTNQSRRGWLLTLGAPLSVVGLILLISLMISASQSTTGATNITVGILALLLMVGVLVAPVCLGLAARDHFRRARTLGRDLRAGSIELYQFSSQTGVGTTPVEILPSGLIWRSDGWRTEKWETVNRVETAAPPEFAAIAAEWLEPVPGSEMEGLHLGHRELSQAELADLRRYLRRLVLRPAIPAVLLSAWAGMGVTASLLHGRLPQGFHLVNFAWVSGLAAVSLFHLAKALRVAFRLRRDQVIGRVIIVRQAMPETAEGGSPAGAMSPPAEYLPESRWVWTVDGQPAPWRTHRGL